MSRWVWIRRAGFVLAVCMATASARAVRAAESAIEVVLRETKPLDRPRGGRLPLYAYGLGDFRDRENSGAEMLLRSLNERGIGAFSYWNAGARGTTLKEGLRIGAIQEKLGMEVAVEVTGCLSGFFDGSEGTAHVDAEGRAFFDKSFGGVKMGCPFTVEARIPLIRERFDFFAEAYRKAGRKIDFAFADWEVDGPIEWNGAWKNSKRCARCRERIPGIEDFGEFQKALREIRCRIQREAFAEPILARFPAARVGNYAVYHNGRLRYWYDYFEKLPEGAPFKSFQGAKYRYWREDFNSTGYTCAMPVVYTWYPIFGWYDYANPDFRWFHNMLLTGSDAARHDAKPPIVTFVHWHTTDPPEKPNPAVKPLSAEKYQELLWHLLLRGHDTFFLWCLANETGEEIRLLHQVYRESMEYSDFLLRGTPVTYETPVAEGPVVSGMRLGDRVLARRTDFGSSEEPATLEIDGRRIEVGRAEGRCQVLRLDNR